MQYPSGSLRVASPPQHKNHGWNKIRLAVSWWKSIEPSLRVDKRRSPRRLERFPLYLLNVLLHPKDVDTSFEPGKSVFGFKVSGCHIGVAISLIPERG